YSRQCWSGGSFAQSVGFVPGKDRRPRVILRRDRAALCGRAGGLLRASLPSGQSRSDGGAPLRMTNDEILMTKELLSPNDEGKACKLAGTIWTFVLGHSFDIRHSDFVIAQSQDSSAEFG